MSNKKVELRPKAISTKEAAKFLGISNQTLRTSRTTGMLLGSPAPAYKKIGRTVLYEISALEAWWDNQPTFNNTAEEEMYGDSNYALG